MMGSTRQTPIRVVVLGGSYCGLAAALNLGDLCLGKNGRNRYEGPENQCKKDMAVDITIVDERDGYYHLIGSPLVMASQEYAEKAWVRYADLPALQGVPNIHTVHGRVTAIDCAAKRATVVPAAPATASELDYDFLIVATGLRRSWPVVPQSLTRSAYLAEVAPLILAVSTAPDGVLVVGGGAVGIEMAAELKTAQPQTKVTLAHSRAHLLSSEPLPKMVGDKCAEVLRETGVRVLLDHRLKQTRPVSAARAESTTTTKEVVFTNGHTMPANTVIMAISQSVPTATYLPGEALDEQGYVKIKPSLFLAGDIPHADSILAAGDIAAWSGIKRCGRAMSMGYHAAFNVHQRLQQLLFGIEPTFYSLKEIPPMLAVSIGHDAVAYGPEGLSSGKDVANVFFEGDVGFQICWNSLKLDRKPGEADEIP